jgi:DNA replication protein DnaC
MERRRRPCLDGFGNTDTDDRQGQGATLITSQFPVNQWHEVIADATVADAILDRLVHNAYRIELKGESMRKGKTTPSESEN